MYDAKYAATPELGEENIIDTFLLDHQKLLGPGRAKRIKFVVDNVSYSKEKKRIRDNAQTEEHLTCKELHWCGSFFCPGSS
jgi:hypothetical protein